MTDQSQRSVELEAALAAANERAEAAQQALAEAKASLERIEAQRGRIDSLRKLVESLEGLREEGGECPIFGGPIDAERYDRMLATARPEIIAYDQRLPALRNAVADADSEWRSATGGIAEAEQKLEKQRQRDREEQREERRRALAERIRQLEESAAQPLREMSVRWIDQDEDRGRLKRTAALVFLLIIGLSVLIPMIRLPPPEPPDENEIRERLAELVVEEEPEPEPEEQEPEPAEPVEEEPEEAPEEQVAERESEPREEVPEPTAQAVAEARERASQTGLLALNDALEEIASNSIEDKLGSNADISTEGTQAEEVSRDILTAEAATAGSGGIETASLSRNVGGSGGSVGERETSRVESALAEQAAQGQRRARTAQGQEGRTDQEIQIVFDRNKSALYRIYNRALRRNPTLQGKVTLKLTIEPSGQVSMIKVIDSDLGDPAVAKKIAARVRLFNFGAKDVAPVTITYPIDFLPA